MKVFAEQSGSMSFDINQDGHKFTLDAKEEYGGQNLGPSPKMLLLSGLLGCTGMDITSFLKKMHTSYDTLKMEAETELTDEHPRVFTDITIKYFLTGQDLDISKVKKAVKLSEEKYCGVSAMLGSGRKITSVVFVNGLEY